jgi:coenzyme PQQ synthesis protein D (PqqD)
VAARPRARADLSYVELDDNVAVYDEVGRVLIMLNVSACAILQSCDGRRTFGAIVAQLAEEYAADLDAIREDAWRTLRKLASMGLVAEGA